MKLLHSSIVLTLFFTQTVFSKRHNRMGSQNAIMAALQNMMGPQNYENAMSTMRMGNRLPAYKEPVPVMPQQVIPREMNMPMAYAQKYPCQMEQMYSTMMEYPKMAGLPVVPNVPATVPAQMALYPQSIPEVVALPVSYPPMPVQEKRGCSCSCHSPTPLVSPFLPSASPVSPWAPPTSNLLPPVVPNQVRSHFLRKIPIPPPTL